MFAFRLVILPRCVPSSTVITKCGQASLVSERYESATAAGLALMVDIAEVAIASIDVTPDFAVRHARPQFELIDQRFMLVECATPCGMLADGRGHAKLLIVSQIDAFSRTCAF